MSRAAEINLSLEKARSKLCLGVLLVPNAYLEVEISMPTTGPPLASASSSKPHPPITILKRARTELPLAQTKFLKKTAKGKVLNSECSFYSIEQYQLPDAAT